jgi:hypothetical protein
MALYDEYAPRMAAAAKWLHPDGSVTGADGSGLLPPDAARAADYGMRSPMAAKWLLADGSVVSELPGFGEGDGGGGSPGGGTAEPPPAIEIHLPIIATDALGGVAVLDDHSVTGCRIDAKRAVMAPTVTDAATADIT